MASGNIFGPYAPTTSTKPFQVVKVKRAWADAWTIVPWITAQVGSDGTAKGLNDMTFEWRFGRIVQPGMSITQTIPWLNIAGCYIAVDVYDQYGGAPLWIGYVDEHTISPFASATVSAGIQTFKAIGLKQHLYFKPILGSYAQCYGGVAMTDEVITFNKSDRLEKFVGLKGANMSPTPNADGVYNFYESTSGGDEALNWTHARCIDYLLYYFCNGEGVGGYDGPKYYLSGPQELYDELDSLIGTFDCDESVGVALDMLINEKRGMSWRIITTGEADAPVFIDIFSFFEDLNPDVAFVDTFTNLLQPTVTFNRAHSYDVVHVQGGPISLCATWSPGYADNGFFPLDPQWSAADESEYLDIADSDPSIGDARRGSEKYHAVFQRFQVPTDWDWYNGTFNAAPYPTDGAGTDPAFQSPQFMGSLRFERHIPFYESTDDAQQPELRKAFVLAEIHDEGDSETSYFYYIEKLSKGGVESASLSLSDDSLGILVEPAINHISASGYVDPLISSEYSPEYSFNDYLFTGMVKTNSRLRCSLPVVNTTIPNEIPHVKVIEMKDAELILIAPLTVVDVDPDDPRQVIQTPTGPLATIFRDDSQRIIDNAMLAAKFYSQQQCVARIVFRGILYDFWPGGIIDGLFTIEGYTAVGTVVLTRQWNFEENTTTITTGFQDIEADKGRSQRGAGLGQHGRPWQPGDPVIVDYGPGGNGPVNWNGGGVDWNGGNVHWKEPF